MINRLTELNLSFSIKFEVIVILTFNTYSGCYFFQLFSRVYIIIFLNH